VTQDSQPAYHMPEFMVIALESDTSNNSQWKHWNFFWEFWKDMLHFLDWQKQENKN
jgi:hypothetical protein